MTEGCRIVDIENGKILKKISPDPYLFNGILSTDYKSVFMWEDTGSGNNLNEYNIETGELINRKGEYGYFPVIAVDLRKDGQFLLTMDRTDSSLVMKIASVNSKESVKTSTAMDIPKGINAESSIAEFSQKGNYAAVAVGRKVYLYDISDLTSSVSDAGLLNN